MARKKRSETEKVAENAAEAPKTEEAVNLAEVPTDQLIDRARAMKAKQVLDDMLAGKLPPNTPAPRYPTNRKNPEKRAQETKTLEEAAAEQKVVYKNGRLGPGNNAGPWGRKGKDGTKGFSFRRGFETFFSKMSPEEETYMWQALAQKAAQGDVQAAKLLLSYNKELDNNSKMEIEQDNGVRITFTVPQREE